MCPPLFPGAHAGAPLRELDPQFYPFHKRNKKAPIYRFSILNY